MNIDDWKSQMKRGLLEYCVLLLITQKDTYGYQLMAELDKFSVTATKESTIYPLLRRLEKAEYLSSYWKNMEDGVPSRKYYSITEKGELYKQSMNLEWVEILNSVKYMRGDNNE